LTLDTATADAAPTRRSRRPAASADAPAAASVMTRAEWRRLQAERAEIAEAGPVARPAVEERTAEITAPVVAEVVEPHSSLAEQVIAEVLTEAVAETTSLRRRTRIARSGSAAFGASIVSAPADVPAIPIPAHTPAFLDTAFAAPAAAPSLSDSADVDADAFDLAARLLAFTGETPAQVARAVLVAEEAAAAVAPASDLASRGRRGRGQAFFQRFAATSFSVCVMGAVGLLAIGTTTPASAVAALDESSADITIVAPEPLVADEEIQAYVAASDLPALSLDRLDGYDVASMSEIAADSGVTQFAGTWISDPNGQIQWPFPVGVPVSAAYGSKTYLSKFSSPHRGVDLTPGTGAEVHAIADGTVRIATEAGGDYGVNVVIDHIIDGQLVSTRYAHMQYRSLQVSAGDTVSVGDVLGTVGSTGKATGPHLHFEVLLGGTAHTDPLTWMYAHTEG